jgi:hypothetical protein
LRRDYKKKLLTKAIQKAGSQSKLATLIKKHLNYPKIKQSTVSLLLKKDTLRLDLVYFLLDYLKIKFDCCEIIAIKGFGTSKAINRPKLKITLGPELAQILANLYCDGSIEKNNCYVSTYMNGNLDLIQRFKQNFTSCFGNYEFYERKTNVNNVRIPCFIGKVLYQKFNLGEDNVPDQIINSDKKIKSAYLQAAFDDEGSIHKDHGQIRIKMKPKFYIGDIQKMIREFGINTSSVIEEIDKRNGRKYYYFLISGRNNLREFNEKIGFLHPNKKKRLEKRLKIN